MVVTRSQGNAAGIEEVQDTSTSRSDYEYLQPGTSRAEYERLRTGMEKGQVPATSSRRQETERRIRSPTGSVASFGSTTSIRTRMQLARMKAAEEVAAIKKKELAMEAAIKKKELAMEAAIKKKELAIEKDLVEQRLETEILVMQDEQEDDLVDVATKEDRPRVDEWLRTNPVASRAEEGSQKDEQLRPLAEPVVARNKSDIEQLADAIGRMARPRLHHSDLPTFTGSPTDWLPFKASYIDTTKMYNVSKAENIQRLRSCLKGEARNAVAALLHTATDPEAIIKTLEQCFGRPEVIIDRALDELKKIQRPGSSATELNAFAIKIQNVVCVLEAMDRRGYLYNPLLTREVLEKLSPHLRTRWCDFAHEREGAAEPEVVVLSKFLMREADRALRYSYTPAMPTIKKETRSTPATFQVVKKKVYTTSTRAQENAELCPKCKAPHQLSKCPDYLALTINKRWEFVKEQKRCFKCIDSKHQRFQCKAKRCGVEECVRSHHSTLHKDPQQRTQEPEAVMSIASQTPPKKLAVLLKMCPVIVSGPRGEIKTYALLDEGATVTLIDEDLAKAVGAEGPLKPLHMQGANMSQTEKYSRAVTVQAKGEYQDQIFTLRARTIKDLCLHTQSVTRDLATFEHLRDLPAEEICYKEAKPGLLVGTDHWECIVSRRLRVGKPNEPAASQTQLGWVVHGTVPRTIITDGERVLHFYEKSTPLEDDERLHELVERNFRIESLGIGAKPRVSEEDRRALEIVSKTIRMTQGRFEVGLPWRQDNVKLPNSYAAALRRLKGIEKKMDADPVFGKAYAAMIQNLLDKGYAVPCDGTEDNSDVCWYLPHFAVQNPNKPGKQRLVFDAAARSNGLCLNDRLLEGPDMLMPLPGILFRFREKAVAVTADIQEMFLQILIRKEDQPAQQFLWRGKHREGPPQRYKMVRMIFGAASSPFMAHYVRNHNAELHTMSHPRAKEVITKGHYVDDMVVSFDSPEEARRAAQETRAVHSAAGFVLRSWNTNIKSVLQDIPEELRATAPKQLCGDQPENKILGLVWDAERDELGFNTSMNRVPPEVRRRERAPTKRQALSAVMSIYDPLGLLSHYTIRAKIMLQSLWNLQISWDEPIPMEEGNVFSDWLARLSDIEHLRFDRCYAPGPHEVMELHIMCDASEQAYAAVAYWRILQEDGEVDVKLVAAKAKVAPRRSQTIPRLELQAAVLGARLADTINREHRYKIGRTTYWTDSSTVVHWIKNDARRYTPFVAHRLGEISELTNRKEWRWLPTELNVADDATRLSDSKISATDRWFQGPCFLRKPEELWPSQKVISEEEDENCSHVYEITNRSAKRLYSWLPDPERFSKYERLVRATATVLAFIDIRVRKTATRLELRHLEKAENLLLQRAQYDSFGEDIDKIRSQRPLAKESKLLKLDPVLKNGLLKVRGRIGAATVPVEMKAPIILDGRHPLTKLIVLKEHCAAGHANRERVTNDLRQKFFIMYLRPTVRATERNCAFCRTRKARPQVPATGDLPRARLEPFQRPFSNCGLDYFGPMTVKIGRRREKRWGALFTCLTSRAVHIELVPSLSRDSAIMALRRMAARRGWPRIMYSDNATNFRGADQELRNAYAEWQPALREEGLLHRMEWRYIPPGAPNQGGAWERLVRSVKAALSVTLKERVPTEEVLLTLLAEAEHSINARPLTYVSVDPDDPEALTPNHFLLGSSTGLPSTGPCTETDRRTWRTSQALADHFWRRWLREYLPTLVPRGEARKNMRPIQRSDVVIVVDNSLPRNTWPMGIVEDAFSGPDGAVRVAVVRTRTGTFRRPVSKLVVLQEGEATQAAPGGENVVDTTITRVANTF